ncbi:RELT-like protein 1 [Aplochiton taeniatus]
MAMSEHKAKKRNVSDCEIETLVGLKAELMALTPAPSGGTSQEGLSHDSHPENIAFVLVPVFFLLGLLGVLICHILKRKGYRCTTAAEQRQEEEEAAEAEKLARDLEGGADLNDTYSEGNNDTVGQIVHYIMKNEANSDALKAMVHENSVDSDGPITPTSPDSPAPPLTPVSPTSPGAPAAALGKHTCSHLHTISGTGGTGGRMNMCNRCNHKKWPLMRKPPGRKASRTTHAEVTVLSVGRFRVTKCDKVPRERRTLLITDSNGSVPTSPTEAKSRTTSESQPQDPADNPDNGK